MDKKIVFGRSIKDILYAFALPTAIALVACTIAYNYVNPAPPNHIVISTGNGEGDYQTYAKQYRDILKDDGVNLEIRTSSGAVENLKRLQDENSDVEVGFVQDGLGNPDDAPDLSSLGSLYYEPLWIFYQGKQDLHRLSELKGKKIAIGSKGGGVETLAMQLLKANGVTHDNAEFVEVGSDAAESSLTSGQVTAAIFLATADDPTVDRLIRDPRVNLMSIDQAEAITRQLPFLHHLVLPHGAMDLARNIPAHDVDLVSPTATLLVRDTLHPALIYLLLKAAEQVHNTPGMFEEKGEFPIDKDFQFPLADEAKVFYKTGPPFWQKFLPFWLATLLDRFLLVLIPIMALALPLIKLVPKMYIWRIRSRVFKRYGELKFLEAQIQPGDGPDQLADYLNRLDVIEENVNQMKVPLNFSDFIYGLRQNIELVRGRLRARLSSVARESGGKRVSQNGPSQFEK
jgi:TRAP transporter TAXI family solute receptor